MYLKFEDGCHDFELTFLQDLFCVLDSRLDNVHSQIDVCSDPDQMGFFDDAEYMVGTGLVACQRYLASTYGPLGISKQAAIEVGPCHSQGTPVARIINAAANFWKHHDEWGLHAVVHRNRDLLSPVQRGTIEILETVTPWDDYTCCNLLFELTSPNEPRFRHLVPQLEAWRDAVDSLTPVAAGVAGT